MQDIFSCHPKILKGVFTMKKSILSVVSIILTFLISCSMTLPAFAKESSLTTTAENDVEDDFDEN